MDSGKSCGCLCKPSSANWRLWCKCCGSTWHRFGLKRLAKAEIKEIYSYIFNLQGNHPLPESSDQIAEEIANERIQWNDDGIKSGVSVRKAVLASEVPEVHSYKSVWGVAAARCGHGFGLGDAAPDLLSRRGRKFPRQETFRQLLPRKDLDCVVLHRQRPAVLFEAEECHQPGGGCVGWRAWPGIIQDLDHGIAYTQSFADRIAAFGKQG